MHYVRHANCSPFGQIHPFETEMANLCDLCRSGGGGDSILWLKEHAIGYKNTDSTLIQPLNFALKMPQIDAFNFKM